MKSISPEFSRAIHAASQFLAERIYDSFNLDMQVAAAQQEIQEQSNRTDLTEEEKQELIDDAERRLYYMKEKDFAALLEMRLNELAEKEPARSLFFCSFNGGAIPPNDLDNKAVIETIIDSKVCYSDKIINFSYVRVLPGGEVEYQELPKHGKTSTVLKLEI